MRIETARLILRPFLARDEDHFMALFADPALAGDPLAALSREDCRALFEFYLACWQEEDLAYGAIERRGDGAFLGISGLAILREPPLCEIGWALFPRYQRQGYAAEAARGWLDYGFGTLGLDRVVALTRKGNPRSVRVMERLAFEIDPAFVHPDGEVSADRLAFAMTAARWRALPARAAS